MRQYRGVTKYYWHCTGMQALRLGSCSARRLIPSGLVGIVVMGKSLRQLALQGVQHVLDASLVTALAQLPMLQVSHLGKVLH